MAITPDSNFSQDNMFRRLFNEDGTLSYNAVLSFLEDLENGVLNDVSKDDCDKISKFIAFLAKQGIMPDTTDEEKAEIEKDIKELLDSNNDAITYQNAFYDINNYQIIPCIYYGQSIAILRTNWISHKFKQVVKFIDKHKTEVIIGTLLVVATVAVVATVVIASSAAAAATAATAAAGSKSKDDKKEEESSTTNSNTVPNNPSIDLSDPALQKLFDNQLSSLKNTAIENNLQLKLDDQNYPQGSNERIIGATLAHEALNNIPQNIQGKNEDLITQTHGKIDNAFSTCQTPFYFDYKNTNGSGNLQENVFYFQGQEALKTQHYDQAIDNFGKALEITVLPKEV
ncbi:MAG: hypothetical protein HZB76_03905 [Chlamydiae bacterium]|nr:hypothetical protein [Chlamydiota bacterium]